MKITLQLLFIFIGVIELVASVTADTPTVRPYIETKSATAPLKIDGFLDEADWGSAAVASNFMRLGGASAAPNRTQVLVLRDGAKIVFGFRAAFPAGSKLRTTVTEPDKEMWLDDCLQVLIDPTRDGSGFYHIAVNSGGHKYDSHVMLSKGRDVTWDSNAQVASTVRDGEWTVEIAIPFSSFKFTQTPGATWSVMFGRFDKVAGAESSWPTSKAGSLMDSSAFGVLTFGPTVAEMADLPQTGFDYGENPVSVWIRNPGSEAVSVRPDLVIAGPRGVSRVAGEPTVVPGGAVVQSSVRFMANDEGRYSVHAELHDFNGTVVLRSEQIGFGLDSLDAGLVDFIRRSLSRAAGKDPKARKELETVNSEIKSLLKKPAKNEAAPEWPLIKQQIRVLRNSAVSADFSAQARALPGYNDTDTQLVVTLEPTINKVFADEFYSGRVVNTIELRAAKREWESAQIVVAPLGSKLSGVRVTASPLRSAGGVEIPATDVSVNLVGYVRTTKPPYESVKVGLWPDPLLPNAPMEVTEDRVQPYWVTVRTRGDTPAGDYEGTLTVTRDGATKPLVLALRVKVWDFALPQESRMKTAISITPNDINARYSGKTETNWGDSLRPYWQTFVQPLLDARMGVYFAYSFTAYADPILPRWDWKNNQPLDFSGGDQAVSFLLKDGYSGLIDIGYLDGIAGETKLGAQDYNDMFMRYLGQVVPHMRELGWLDRCMIYGAGSVAPEAMGKYAELISHIKETYPDLRIVVGTNPEAAYERGVDIWVPWMFWFNSADVRAGFTRRMQTGTEFWWQSGAYNFAGPRWCPIMTVDVCGVDPRIAHWMAWKAGVTGYLYWGATYWRGQYKDQNGKFWPEAEWICEDGKSGAAGDGFLLYPGPDGQPLQSIRFVNFRDGIEDYDYFAILKDAVDKLKGAQLDKAQRKALSDAQDLLDIPDSICSVVGRWTTDSALISQYREQIANSIIRLQKIPVANGNGYGK